MNTSKKSKLKLLLYYFLVCFIIFNMIYFLYTDQNNSKGFFEKADLFFTDLKFSFFEDSNKNTKEILILAIDNKTVKELGYPLSRDIYGFILQKARENKAKVVGFDLLFLDFDENNQKDLYFLTQLNRFENTVLAMQISKGNDMIFSNPYIRHYAKTEGFIDMPVNIDGIVRDTKLIFMKLDENNQAFYYLSFAASIYKQYLSYDKALSFEEFSNFLSQNHRYKDKIIINYSGPRDTFDTISISDILEKNFDFSIFYDKIVIVGPTYSASQDFFMTPYNTKKIDKKLKKYQHSGNTYMPGVEIHANIINTLINKNNLQRIKYNYFSFLFIFCLLSLMFLPIIRLSFNIILFLAILIFTLIVNFKAFEYNLLFDYAPLLSSIMLLFLNSIVFKILSEKFERIRIKNMFGKYLDKKIIDTLLQSNEELKPGGDSKVVSILFSDIANFTSISEKYSDTPEKVVDFLNNYFDKMVELITENKGILDKFIGDAVMANFGFPIESLHADNIVNCAVLMKKKIFEFKQNWKQDFDFNVRIGINTGKVIIGNIGSSKRMEFTVIGDNVNLASRLEGVNKVFGTNIIISEFTYNYMQNKNNFFIRELDLIRVKGKNLPVKIYEVIDFYDEKNADIMQIISNFEQALLLYRECKFEKAYSMFIKNVNDAPSVMYAERCTIFIKNPPPKDWDKVFTLTKK